MKALARHRYIWVRHHKQRNRNRKNTYKASIYFQKQSVCCVSFPYFSLPMVRQHKHAISCHSVKTGRDRCGVAAHPVGGQEVAGPGVAPTSEWLRPLVFEHLLQPRACYPTIHECFIHDCGSESLILNYLSLRPLVPIISAVSALPHQHLVACLSACVFMMRVMCLGL